jgi:quercetin dioxygenase-like cupin family protein
MILDDGNVRLEIVRGARATNGEVLEMRATYRPGSRPPPAHYHPSQEERFTVHAGALWFEVDGVPCVVEAGDTLVVPPRAVHRARNARKDEPAVVTWETRPALRSEEMFTALYEARSTLARVAALHRFREEMRLPSRAEGCVLALLGPLARALAR